MTDRPGQPNEPFSRRRAHGDNPLFFPVTNGDDTFALAVPLEIIAIERALVREVAQKRVSRPHIFPEITLYSPLSV